jgi:hypothetical protein
MSAEIWVGLTIKSAREEEEVMKEIEARLTATELIPASIAHDLWSLGAVLYCLCANATLFLCDGDGNITDDGDLRLLGSWPDDVKARKLQGISNPEARNLVHHLLSKDPVKRPGIARILQHPFLTGKRATRLDTDLAEFDAFLSYRVASDSKHVEALYNALTSVGLKVWWDKKCLLPGEPWEEGFCRGLVKSAVFIPILSKGAIRHPTSARQNFELLTESSACDNVLLEHRLALELRDRNLIEVIYPLYIGDLDSATNQYKEYIKEGPDRCHPVCPQVAVKSVEGKLREHLELQGLGEPYRETMTVREVMADIEQCGGCFVPPSSTSTSSSAAATAMAAIVATAASTGTDALASTLELLSHTVKEQREHSKAEYAAKQPKKTYSSSAMIAKLAEGVGEATRGGGASMYLQQNTLHTPTQNVFNWHSNNLAVRRDNAFLYRDASADLYRQCSSVDYADSEDGVDDQSPIRSPSYSDSHDQSGFHRLFATSQLPQPLKSDKIRVSSPASSFPSVLSSEGGSRPTANASAVASSSPTANVTRAPAVPRSSPLRRSFSIEDPVVSAINTIRDSEKASAAINYHLKDAVRMPFHSSATGSNRETAIVTAIDGAASPNSATVMTTGIRNHATIPRSFFNVARHSSIFPDRNTSRESLEITDLPRSAESERPAESIAASSTKSSEILPFPSLDVTQMSLLEGLEEPSMQDLALSASTSGIVDDIPKSECSTSVGLAEYNGTLRLTSYALTNALSDNTHTHDYNQERRKQRGRQLGNASLPGSYLPPSENGGDIDSSTVCGGNGDGIDSENDSGRCDDNTSRRACLGSTRTHLGAVEAEAVDDKQGESQKESVQVTRDRLIQKVGAEEAESGRGERDECNADEIELAISALRETTETPRSSNSRGSRGSIRGSRGLFTGTSSPEAQTPLYTPSNYTGSTTATGNSFDTTRSARTTSTTLSRLSSPLRLRRAQLATSSFSTSISATMSASAPSSPPPERRRKQLRHPYPLLRQGRETTPSSWLQFRGNKEEGDSERGREEEGSDNDDSPTSRHSTEAKRGDGYQTDELKGKLKGFEDTFERREGGPGDRDSGYAQRTRSLHQSHSEPTTATKYRTPTKQSRSREPRQVEVEVEDESGVYSPPSFGLDPFQAAMCEAGLLTFEDIYSSRDRRYATSKAVVDAREDQMSIGKNDAETVAASDAIGISTKCVDGLELDDASV